MRRAVRVLISEAQVVVGAEVQAPLCLACQRQSPAKGSRGVKCTFNVLALRLCPCMCIFL